MDTGRAHVGDEVAVSPGTRIAEGIAALVLGVAVGGIGTFAHQLVWSDLAVPVPLGLIAALVAVACLLVGVRIVFDSRMYAVAAAVGVVAAVAILALPGANGSVLLPDNLAAVVWSVGPTVIAVVALGWPRIRGAGWHPRSAHATGSQPGQ